MVCLQDSCDSRMEPSAGIGGGVESRAAGKACFWEDDYGSHCLRPRDADVTDRAVDSWEFSKQP